LHTNKKRASGTWAEGANSKVERSLFFLKLHFDKRRKRVGRQAVTSSPMGLHQDTAAVPGKSVKEIRLDSGTVLMETKANWREVS